MAKELQHVKSSLISSYAYDVESQTLSVAFVTDPDTTHNYSPVPPPVMSQVFDTAQSIGSMFHRLIRKGNYKHTLANE